jgi:hypothetical protein
MRQAHVVGELHICAENFLAGAAFTLQLLRVLLHETGPMLTSYMVKEGVLGERRKSCLRSRTDEAPELLQIG